MFGSKVVCFNEDCHISVHHSGLRGSLAKLRTRYSFPRARQIVKTNTNKCVTCRKVGGKLYSAPPTPALLEFRTCRTIMLRVRNNEMSKVYIALYSCCVMRVVHLHLVADLTSQTFRRVLGRFQVDVEHQH